MAKSRDSGVSLDSFLDILTCLQGVLMLIIITTGIDAARTKVLVKTPLQVLGNEKPIYIEARNNKLYRIPLDDIKREVAQARAEIARTNPEGDTASILQTIGDTKIVVGDYVVDMSYAMVGQIALLPNPDTTGGYTFEDPGLENANTWYGRIIAEMDKENEKLSFIVRDDSFPIFKRARVKAWTDKAKVGFQLIGQNEPIRFGGPASF